MQPRALRIDGPPRDPGRQVVVEDHVREEGGRLFLIVLINFLCILAAALAIFAVLKIALAGSAA